MSRATWRGLLFGLAVGLGVFGQTPVATLVAPPEGWRIREGTMADLDGDQELDLVLSVISAERPFVHQLAMHLAKKEGPRFGAPADAVLRLTPDVVGFAAADVNLRPGAELILFNPRAAFAVDPFAKADERPRKLFEAAFLWQFPDDEDLVLWARGVADVDADGDDDFLIPEPSGVVVARQERTPGSDGQFSRIERLAVPEDRAARDHSRSAMQVRGRGARKEISLKLGATPDDGFLRPLLEVSEFVPAPFLADFDGDRRLDVVLRTAERFCVWRQSEAMSFSSAPDLAYPIPVVLDQARLLDLSYRAHADDFDGDGKQDCLLVAGNAKAKDARAQVLVYLQGKTDGGARATTPEAPLFGPRGVPRQVIGLAGFVASTALADIDGDGRPDFLATTFEPDLVDQLRSRGGDLDLGLSVFLNREGTFATQADLVTRISLRSKSLDAGREFFRLEVLPDGNRDGLAELLIQDDSASFRIQKFVRQGRNLGLEAEPSLRFHGPRGRVSVVRRKGLPSELLYLSAAEAHHWRWTP